MTPAAPTPDRVTAVLRNGDELLKRAKQLGQQIDRHLAERRRLATRITAK